MAAMVNPKTRDAGHVILTLLLRSLLEEYGILEGRVHVLEIDTGI